MKRLQIIRRLVSLAVLAALTACTSVTLTNRNATEPVMVGQLDHIGARKVHKEKAYPLIHLNKFSRIIFLLLAYDIASNADHDFESLADAQVARAVEDSRCTHRISSIRYEAATFMGVAITAFENNLTAMSDGAVKCVR